MALDYYVLDDALAELDPTESAAFLHGSLLARLICGERLDREAWLNTACALLEIETPPTGDQADPLQSLYDESLTDVQHMAPQSDGPMPFLPNNDSPLPDRLEALADWCAAFVSTLGMVGRLQAPDEDDQELLSDLIAISQLDASSEEQSPDAEDDYTALLAHVRLAGRHFYERFAPPSAETPVH
ncbi:MAG: UPF0149 family protein [Natronospirillum sp.]|uniref:UPF0149 family protein n=1 Tax=Natronospirillum sp. TaxID=2812955 RepID=UPI0025EACCF8|nr:UPF0149 family protein [Natronospirillum sp.]MCH8551446.1 UPF0149 family protein [Natronospirillum sp.]